MKVVTTDADKAEIRYYVRNFSAFLDYYFEYFRSNVGEPRLELVLILIAENGRTGAAFLYLFCRR